MGVMCADKMLLAVDQHQGYEILDLLGAAKQDGETSLDTVSRALNGHLNTRHAITDHGTFTSYITKPEGTVQLECDVYKVNIDNQADVLTNPERPTIWLTRGELYNDPRNRRNNRLFDMLFREEPIHIKIHENQMGLWIDAEITDWKEQ